MSTYEMLEQTITNQKKKGPLTQSYKESTLKKMDVFLMADRINEEEYSQLNTMLA